MNTFVSQTSPVTGKLEWLMRSEDYDYHQEVARSTYGDMLHDTERNKLYEVGLKQAIMKVHARGHKASVLDIGTGTGLLSMMAVRAGADRVVACEAFKAMADCAENVIKLNGMSDKIRVIKKRSTELQAEEIGGRVNIVVAEVFDTELIGEGAISTFEHASRCLLDPEVRYVVPSRAQVMIQPVSCAFFKACHQFMDVPKCGGGSGCGGHGGGGSGGGNDGCGGGGDGSCGCGPLIATPPDISTCAGAASVHDIQLDQLPTNNFISTTNPIVVFDFDFTEKKKKLLYDESRVVTMECRGGGSGSGCVGGGGCGSGGSGSRGGENVCDCGSGCDKGGGNVTIDCIFMWWQLYMDDNDDGNNGDGDNDDSDKNTNRVVLSTAPRWAHPTPNNMQWRDHWMQAVYYPTNKLSLVIGEKFEVDCHHDEYSLWFDLQKCSQLDHHNKKIKNNNKKIKNNNNNGVPDKNINNNTNNTHNTNNTNNNIDNTNNNIDNTNNNTTNNNIDNTNNNNTTNNNKSISPTCSCMGHVVCSRGRLGMMNDVTRNYMYVSALKKLISSESIVFSLSDDSLLPLMAAKLGAKKVFTIQTRPLSQRFIHSYIRHNELLNKVKVIDKNIDELDWRDLDHKKIDVIIGEPYYSTSLLPWHNLHFLYAKSELIKFTVGFEGGLLEEAQQKVGDQNQQNGVHQTQQNVAQQTQQQHLNHKQLPQQMKKLKIMPCRASIKAMGVSFKDLQKVRGTNLGECEGFNMKAFDDLIGQASDQSDATIEPHPLWEYPALPMTLDCEVMSFDLDNFDVNSVKRMERKGFAEFITSGECNAVVVWMEYDLQQHGKDSSRVSCGLKGDVRIGEYVKWDEYTRQGVYFFKMATGILSKQSQLHHCVSFHPKNGEFQFDFNIL